MKLLIQKTDETKGNIKKIELTSSDFENNTNTYVIKENESPIIYLTDTESSYFIDDIDSKLERVNSETVAIITMGDLISLGGGTGGDSRPYKVYTALLTQTGTDAPVATVLENTLGGDIVWSRDGTGVYYGTLAGAFIENKTLLPNDLFLSADGSASGVVTITNTLNTINIVVSDAGGSNVDDFLSSGINSGRPFLIEIRVYN